MKKRKMLNVIPECYVDTNLIEYLLEADVNHQHCCSKVVGQLNTTFSDKFAVGIIDKDKVRQGYLDECIEIAKTSHLTLLKHKERFQFLITIFPAVDGFVLACAKNQNVNSMDFGIPSDLKGFTTVSKSITSNKDIRFKHLFEAIKNDPELLALRNTLNYLVTNEYKSDLKQLKLLFKV